MNLYDSAFVKKRKSTIVLHSNPCYITITYPENSNNSWGIPAKLRTCDRDGCDGTVEALENIVPELRKRFPNARIIVRADSGFARDNIMKWCEDHNCYYCIGMAKNPRLKKLLEPAMIRARETACLLMRPSNTCDFIDIDGFEIA